MTRQEFIDSIDSWYELIDFCADEDCRCCVGVYSERERDNYINESLVDIASDAGDWSDLLDTLNDIPTGYEYYFHDDYGDWVGLDNTDFDDYKTSVLEWCDDNDIWEDEEEEEEEEPLPESMVDDDDDDFVVEEEPISIGELMGVCSSRLQQIGNDKTAGDAADDEAFEVFVAGCVTIVKGE